MESEFVVRLLVAAVLGALLGLERSLAGKHAGMRTYALVSMGSALFTAVGVIASYQFQMWPSVTPLHLAGFVVLGVGFIGSGLAIARGEGHPGELTTATGIWVAAGVGLAAGFGYFGLALAAAILSILTFSVLARVERSLRIRYGERYKGQE